MAKKVETIVTLTDDIDGGKADRTVAFTVNGVRYEIDLNKKNVNAFDKALAPYIANARKAKSARSRTAPAAKSSRRDLAAIREWARADGRTVSDRGRIPAEIIDAYEARG